MTRRMLTWLLACLLTVAGLGCGSEKDRGKNRNLDRPVADPAEKR